MSQFPFYRPSDSKVGDVMPCYFDGKFHIYYLRYGMTDKGVADNEYSVIETEDFVHFSEDRRTGIYGGTGEIIKYEGKYHLFKCIGEVDGVTAIGHYIGDTPYRFEQTDLVVPSDNEIYVPWAWRDPRIFWVEEEKCFWMLVATNCKTDNPSPRNACVGLCKSFDLVNWTYCKPLFAPLAFEGTYECPDMFRIGDWYYLVYSNADHNKLTHYVKGKSLYGPWIIPDHDTIDSYLFYAGRVASDGLNHYIAAWNADRTGADLAMKMGLRDVEKCIQPQEEDFAPFGYAGHMVIHQLGQHPNGDLTCVPIPSVVEAFNRPLQIHFQQVQGTPWLCGANNAFVSALASYSSLLAGVLPDRVLIQVDFQIEGREAGLVIGADEHFNDHGLYLRIQPKLGRVQVMNGLREKGGFNGYCIPFAVEMESFIQPDERGMYHLTLMQDGDVLCLYINGQALSIRAQNARGGQLGLFAYDANVSACHISIKEMDR